MLAARPPVAIAARLVAVRSGPAIGRTGWALTIPVWSRPFPAALPLSAAGLARRIARVPELAALEPFHDGRRVLVAQTIEDREDLLGVVRAKRRRLIIDDDRPVGMARGHDVIVTPALPADSLPAQAKVGLPAEARG